MQRCTLVILLLFSTSYTHAEVPVDGYYKVDTLNGYYPYFIIEKGSLKGASGFLYSPICKDGSVQSPPLITDLKAFFEGYPVTRVIDRGNGHYLLTSSLELDENTRFRNISGGTLNALYAELDFNTDREGSFTLRVASAFFTGEGMGTTTCLASTRFALVRVNS